MPSRLADCLSTHVDRPSHDRGQALSAAGHAEAGVAPVREVAQAQHEDESETVEEREYVIGHAACVDVGEYRLSLPTKHIA